MGTWCGPCKQLTPILEKIIKSADDKVVLAKINIDENQQIASQLRIQSIPTVYAFKDKQIANAFQGVLSEKQVIEFIEKCLGSKISDNHSEFFEQVQILISNKKYEESESLLLEFISSNTNNLQAINLYLECLIELKKYEEVEAFIDSLEKKLQETEHIKKIIKKIEIIKNNLSGPSVEEIVSRLENNPNDINLVIELADKYFSIQSYEDSFEILLKNYFKNKERIKVKMVEFFDVLGNSNEHTIHYRKKLSQLMFS